MKGISNKVDFFCHSSGAVNSDRTDVSELTGSDTYKLFYLSKGSAEVIIDSVLYNVSEGDSFAVFPGLSYKITAAPSVQYYWIEISGIKAPILFSHTAFSIENPILNEIPVPGLEKYFQSVEASTPDLAAYYRNGGKMLILLSFYMEYHPEKNGKENNYVRLAKAYIKKHYGESSLSVTTIAEYIKVDRSYLYRLFKKETGASISQFINKYRINNAEMLLINTNLSVKDIASSSGFSDQLYFSKVFKKLTGKSPTQFRSTSEPAELNKQNFL